MRPFLLLTRMVDQTYVFQTSVIIEMILELMELRNFLSRMCRDITSIPFFIAVARFDVSGIK